MEAWAYKGSGINFTPYNEYKLCEKWGCTPSQLRKESWDDVQLALGMMGAENEGQRLAMKDMERKR
jgi:hypothetical protein